MKTTINITLMHAYILPIIILNIKYHNTTLYKESTRKMSSSSCLFADRNSSSSSNPPKELPNLIKSRSVFDGADSSTIPDTNSDSVENDVNKTHANMMHNLHNRAGVDVTVVPFTNEKIRDYSPEELSKLSKEFKGHTSKEESQSLFDYAFNSVTRAFANTKELSSKDRSDELKVGNVLYNEKRMECVSQEERNELDEKRAKEVNNINKYYDNIDKENERYYNMNKEELLFASHSSKFTDQLETRGHDEEYYKIQEELKASEFKQDSSDVTQDDFFTGGTPFED